ncbi:MAG TPA: histidine kinase [Syntrophomonadaceae bacterium]|nr:histidine kinase [Syntrophomonadaceae bacterium]
MSKYDITKHGAFNLAGKWEFYWDQVLSDSDILSGRQKFTLIDAPGNWNGTVVDGKDLPGFGKATYRARVTGIPVGQRLAVRIQNQASAYRLYINDQLVAANGSIGDSAEAPAYQYRPQYAEFTSNRDNFDIILQVSNNAYAVGGMWNPIMFGSFEPMAQVNDAVKVVDYLSIGSLIVMCFFFGIIFTIVRKEKDALILCAIGFLVLVRLLENGQVLISYIFPGMPISGFGWIDYLTGIWIQFFLLYFIYVAYTSLVSKWPIRALLTYSISVSLFIVLFPFAIVASTYMVMNFILLFVVMVVCGFTSRAALECRTGARSLMAVMALILFSMLYEFFDNDLSIVYFLLDNWVLEFMVLFFVQCSIVARRYNEAQRMELGLLKSQIRPHFVHNALATIISVSRKEPERSRALLMDFSSYLRGCYDYEGDDLIPMEEELSFVQAYVALEQARFGDKLKVEYQIEVGNILVPPLILQPLVENAFIHGLREKEEGGTVVVYAVKDKGNSVRIGVRDDGVGMNAKPKDDLKRNGIGIGNINRRLSRLYHTQLTFVVPEGEGCEVYMDLPCREADTSASYSY